MFNIEQRRQDLRYSAVFCFISALYYDFAGPAWEVEVYMGGVVQCLNLLAELEAPGVMDPT